MVSSVGGWHVERAVILGAARTPFGRFGGALALLSAPELGGAAIREAIDRSGVEDAELQHSVFGIVVQAGVGQIPSRQRSEEHTSELQLRQYPVCRFLLEKK